MVFQCYFSVRVPSLSHHLKPARVSRTSCLRCARTWFKISSRSSYQKSAHIRTLTTSTDLFVGPSSGAVLPGCDGPTTRNTRLQTERTNKKTSDDTQQAVKATYRGLKTKGCAYLAVAERCSATQSAVTTCNLTHIDQRHVTMCGKSE